MGGPPRSDHEALGFRRTDQNHRSERGRQTSLVAQYAKWERFASSPGALRTLLQLNRQIDVTAILPTLQVPVLVLHSKADLQVPVDLGRKLAAAISGVKYIEYPAGDHAVWTGDMNHARPYRGVRYRPSRSWCG